MNARKLTGLALLIGLVLLIPGVMQLLGPNGSEASAAAPPRTSSVTDLEQTHGMVPLGEVVQFWEARAASQPLDYISRTHLGSALSAQARESADLVGYEQAEIALRDALSLNTRYLPAKLHLSSALLSQHDFVESRVLANAVLEEDPTALSALALTGDASLELGDYTRAESIYQELAALERSAPIVSRLARLASLTGDNEGAVELATEALELSKSLELRADGTAFYWFQLGHVYFANGNIAAAIDALSEAREIAPGHPGATEKLAFVLAAADQTEAAMDLYEELLAGGGAADLFGLYADLLAHDGQLAAAAEQNALGLALAEETIDAFPAERRHLAGFYATRDANVAIELAQTDLAERQDLGAYDSLAWAMYHTGRYDEADDAINRALEIGARDASIYYHAAAIAMARGDRETAISRLTAAREINPAFHPTERHHAAELARQLDIPWP